MKKIKEYYICDRCNKGLGYYSEENRICDEYNAYFYDLCEQCNKKYKEYEEKIKELDIKFKEITKEYKFGKFLPREDKVGEE